MPLSRREALLVGLLRRASKHDHKPTRHTHKLFYRQLSTALRTIERQGSLPSLTEASRRAYSTENVQGVQGQIAGVDDGLDRDVKIPQGIQGEECANFKMWLQSCRNYGLQNCDEQLENMHRGRKTLSQVLAEQEELIRSIADNYKEKLKETSDVLQQDAAVQGIQGSYQQAVDLLNREDPCPQGVQGENCERFKLWLQNCGRFGFYNCDEQLENFRSGRKTLDDIFREQEELIRSVVQNYRENNSASTSGQNEVSNANSPSTDAPQKSEPMLTQRQKLKRAVKDYGSTVIVFHIAISLLSLGGFYLAVSSGLDVVGLISKLGVGQQILESRLAAGASTFVVAYAVHKVFAPVRIGITLSCTPIIVHRLRGIGFLKTPKA